MKKWKMIVGILLVFILGGLVGSLGTELYHRTLYGQFRKDPEARKRFILQKFTEKLGLSEQQQTAFKSVIDRIDALRKAQSQKHRAEVAKIMDANYLEMKNVLSPEQQQKFAELVQEIRKRKKNHYRRP